MPPENSVLLHNPVGVKGDSQAGERKEGGQIRYRDLFVKNRFLTVTYCMVFWAFGMCVALLGPTLLDLGNATSASECDGEGCKTSNVFSKMSWIFFSQSFFTLVGTASGGFLAQKFAIHPVLLVACIMLAVTLALIPLCNFLLLLALVLGIMGYFMGTIDTVANLSMIKLYGKDVAPFLQALHFFYGLGAFVSPMIVQPFLLNEDCSLLIDNSSEPFLNPIMANITKPATDLQEAQRQSQIQYAFWIMALLQIPVISIVAAVIIREILARKGDSSSKENYEIVENKLQASMFPELLKSDTNMTDRPPTTMMQMRSIAALTAVMVFLYDGLQAVYGGYVYSYAKMSIVDLSSSEAAYLNACFWGTFAFGRLISIWIATIFAPNFMLLCNVVGCLTAMLLMLIMRHDHIVLYIGTCMFGIFMSSVYPTAISYAEKYIHITYYTTTVIVVSAAAGEMSMPVIVGHEFASMGAISFLITGTIMTFLSVFVYAGLQFIANSITRYSATSGVMETLTSCFKGSITEEEDTGLMRHHVKYYSRMQSDISEGSLVENGYNVDDTQINLTNTPKPCS